MPSLQEPGVAITHTTVMQWQIKANSFSTTAHSIQQWHPLPGCRVALKLVLGKGWSMHMGSHRTWTTLFLGGNQCVCVCTLFTHEVCFLQPSCKSHWFSNHIRRLIVLVWGFKARVSNMIFKLLTSQGGPLPLWYPLPLLWPILSIKALAWSFLFLHTWLCVALSLYTRLYRSLSFSHQFDFSICFSTYIWIFNVFLVVGDSSSFTSPSSSSLSWFFWFFEKQLLNTKSNRVYYIVERNLSEGRPLNYHKRVMSFYSTRFPRVVDSLPLVRGYFMETEQILWWMLHKEFYTKWN